MIEFAEKHIRVGERDWRYVEAGDGPLLVWFHGAGGLRPGVGAQLLARSFRVLGLELPGFGTAAEDMSSESFDELGRRAGRALDELGIADALFHGTSFGAAVGLHMALDRPELVKRMVLESPSAFRQVGWRPPDVDTVRRGLFRHPEKLMTPMKVDPVRALAEREYVNRLSSSVDRDVLAERLRGLPTPMRVIFGEFDTLTPPELAGMYCGNAPDCTLVLVEDAAHAVSVDQPEAYAEAVTEFALGGRTAA